MEAYSRAAIGARIKQLRDGLDFTQEEFAEMIDVSTQFVVQFEGGKKGVSIPNLCRIAKTLHVSTDYLLLGEQKSENMEPIYRMLENCSATERKYAEELLKTFLLAMREKNP